MSRTATQPSAASTLDPTEVEKFSRIAAEWWDPNGKFRPLHLMNPARLTYITGAIAAHYRRDLDTSLPFQGLSVLDIGCGGGLLSEPMARLGATVTGVDASEKNIAVAALHAEQSALAIDYRATTAEALAQTGARFDVILNTEVIEHVSDPELLLHACAELLKPGGVMVVTTLNRTAKSYALAIVGAEYVLRWLPRGTHDWKRFLKPSEIARMLRTAGLTHTGSAGMSFDPIRTRWSITDDLSVNYLMTAVKG